MSSPIAQRIIAEHLLRIGAIEFLIENPLRLKSGLISPLYVDNRKLVSHPNAWHDVIETLGSKIEQYGLVFDMIAGVETAGIPHCSALAYRLRLPSLFVRRYAKTHGDKSRIEGADVAGKRVLLIEDHISTGQSTLDAVAALKEQGATITDCLSLTTFDLEDTRLAFKDSGVTFHALLPFSAILNVAVEVGVIDQKQKEIVQEWLNDPWPWAAKYGHLPAEREN